MEGGLRSGEGIFKAQKQSILNIRVVEEEGLIVTLLNVKKTKNRGVWEGSGRG